MRFLVTAFLVLAATGATAAERTPPRGAERHGPAALRDAPPLKDAPPLRDAGALPADPPTPPPRPDDAAGHAAPKAATPAPAPRADDARAHPAAKSPGTTAPTQRMDDVSAHPAAKSAPAAVPRSDEPAANAEAKAPPAPSPAAPAAPSPPATAVSGDACMIELAALGADAPKAEAPAALEADCVIETPVRLKSVAAKDGRIAIHGEPLIACATAKAAALYVAQILAPVAKGATGATLAGVTAAGFECRPRNREPGGKLSAHGKGLALDVTAFQFSDGATTTVAAPGERLAFLNGARKGACGYFTTVLGPGADAAHQEHLHFDIEAHGGSGYGRICQ